MILRLLFLSPPRPSTVFLASLLFSLRFLIFFFHYQFICPHFQLFFVVCYIFTCLVANDLSIFIMCLLSMWYIFALSPLKNKKNG